MKHLAPSTLALLILSPFALAQTPVQDSFRTLTDDERTYFQHVTTLANPFFEGRAPGLRGNVLTAEYVEFNFKRLGLTPAFTTETRVEGSPEGSPTVKSPWSTYRQPFSTGRETVPKMQAMSYTAGGKTITLRPGADFAVRGTSGAAQVDLPVVFVGYGIAEGKDGYNSFEGMDEKSDLSGKIALLLRFEPLNDKGKSRWGEDGAFSNKSTLAGKFRTLANRKAAGVLLVSPPGADDPRTNKIEDTKSSTQGTAMSMPVINLHVDAATAMLAAAGSDLTALRRAADEKGGISDIAGLTVAIDAAVERRPNSTDNVGAVLAGKGALKDDYLVIGAHLDHVGYGLFGSRGGRNAEGKLHPGADDNASGTAGLIILAAKLASDYASLPEGASARSIMFVAFSGEEGGLIGSRHFVKNSPIAASKVYTMLNMDMIGRARHDSQGRPKCQVVGVGTAQGFKELLAPMFEASGVDVKPLPGGQGPSDHASFYKANVPVLHFFTGLHDEYHTPTDTYDLINPTGAIRVVELVRSIANNLAPRTEPLEFTSTQGGDIDYTEPTEEMPVAPAKPVATPSKPPTPAPQPATEPASTPRRARTPSAPEPQGGGDDPAPPSRAGGRVRFGIAPGDYDANTGVLVGDVYPNTPAAEAGLKQGDIITKWNDTTLTSVQDWMPLLSRANPGDKVKLTVKRGTETLTLDCTLKARSGE